MGRSFSRPAPANTLEDFTRATFFHDKSRTWFEMVHRGDRYFQRRWQLDPQGRQVNVEEKSVDYVLGSGNHSRTYLHLTATNTLQQLPLAWYSEDGGHWGMNPGYDQPDHPYSRRVINYECLGCHNAAPTIPKGHEGLGADPEFVLPLPEGIDCRRCHGSTERHIAVAQKKNASRDEIRWAIVNPARLAPHRRMEVCMQCHLETDSSLVSHSIQGYTEGPFSFQPGEVLAKFRLFLDRKDSTQEFQIAQGAYRFRESICFIKSGTAFQCTTCHNPHQTATSSSYTSVCQTCHNATKSAHYKQDTCVSCHMPKRRTEDAVHVVMTDHKIQRPSGADLLARVPADRESGSPYQGELQVYYPPNQLARPDDVLLTAVAKVRERSNLIPDLAQLLAAIDRYRPASAAYYLDAADGLAAAGQLTKALDYYQAAVSRQLNSAVMVRALASALLNAGDAARAIPAIERCLSLAPNDATCWRLRARAATLVGDPVRAKQALEKAITLDPENVEAYHELALLLVNTGDRTNAEAEFREAIRIQPNIAEAHANLANLLSWKPDIPGASFHYLEALRIKPAFFQAHYGYAALLAQTGRLAEATAEAEAALKMEPNSAEAKALLEALKKRR